MLTVDTITDEQITTGESEPFCACGRRWSDCDASRAKCHRNSEARARCAEILNQRESAKDNTK